MFSILYFLHDWNIVCQFTRFSGMCKSTGQNCTQMLTLLAWIQTGCLADRLPNMSIHYSHALKDFKFTLHLITMSSPEKRLNVLLVLPPLPPAPVEQCCAACPLPLLHLPLHSPLSYVYERESHPCSFTGQQIVHILTALIQMHTLWPRKYLCTHTPCSDWVCSHGHTSVVTDTQ